MPGKENDDRAEAILACFEALHRAAFRLVGNKAQSEDLVQETYLRAWRLLTTAADCTLLRKRTAELPRPADGLRS